MSEKLEKILFFGLTMLGLSIFLFFENRYTTRVIDELKPFYITYEDSLYLEITSIVINPNVKVHIVNDSLRICGGYDYIPLDSSSNDEFYDHFLKFRILSKRKNSDTLVAIDRYRQLRLYNVRSGPCYDALMGRHNWFD